MNRLRRMERIARRGIVLDLIIADLTRCKAISEQRKTKELTRILFHEAMTEIDGDPTITMETVANERPV